MPCIRYTQRDLENSPLKGTLLKSDCSLQRVATVTPCTKNFIFLVMNKIYSINVLKTSNLITKMESA